MDRLDKSEFNVGSIVSGPGLGGKWCVSGKYVASSFFNILIFSPTSSRPLFPIIAVEIISIQDPFKCIYGKGRVDFHPCRTIQETTEFLLSDISKSSDRGKRIDSLLVRITAPDPRDAQWKEKYPMFPQTSN